MGALAHGLAWGRAGVPPNPERGCAVAALPVPCRKVPMFGLEAIWRDGKVVGHIRRADFGFAIDKTIAYGYIRDPAGGPVSADPRDGCASLPAATNTHCCHCGGTAAPPVQAAGMSRLGGKAGVTHCRCVGSQHGSSAASGVNCKRIFNCSSELSHVVGSSGQ